MPASERGVDLLHFAEQCPSRCSKRTGTLPTLRSSTISPARECWRRYQAVPSVGCPANGSSSLTVKIRTFTPSRCSIGFLARQNECCFTEVGFARQLLHFFVTETAGVGEHRQLITLEGTVGEYVELNKLERAIGHRQDSPDNLSGIRQTNCVALALCASAHTIGCLQWRQL